jgi:VIT1/CCC1 family predicted Fe2+/Mn2+ transporter
VVGAGRGGSGRAEPVGTGTGCGHRRAGAYDAGMPRWPPHAERHAVTGLGWLRAAVLGANDGIVSTASLLLGVAAAQVERSTLAATGVAALAAGALSMAVGEYVSVSSQRDSEEADIAKERHELERFPRAELEELTGIYEEKGLRPDLAREVAVELSRGDRLAVHLAEELGITEDNRARPLQAALSSAGAFTAGALVPVLTTVVSPVPARVPVTAAAALAALGALGALGAVVGGARPGRATARVVVGGAAAMAVTTGIGHVVGGAIS